MAPLVARCEMSQEVKTIVGPREVVGVLIFSTCLVLVCIELWFATNRTLETYELALSAIAVIGMIGGVFLMVDSGVKKQKALQRQLEEIATNFRDLRTRKGYLEMKMSNFATSAYDNRDAPVRKEDFQGLEEALNEANLRIKSKNATLSNIRRLIVYELIFGSSYRVLDLAPGAIKDVFQKNIEPFLNNPFITEDYKRQVALYVYKADAADGDPVTLGADGVEIRVSS